ncbi:hypothetical protein [Flagellimonas sp.]|uniref:hypothetical protein n=1 Tax=Flagellimonas sp. TaxID=2058762 RepID=UPI003AB39950
MKKILFPLALTASLLFGCSNEDDGPKCESCTSAAGNTFRICESSNGNYKLTGGDISVTITKEEMENATPKQFVQGACDADLPL